MRHETAMTVALSVGAVLIVDDHPLFGEALSAALAQLFPSARIAVAATLAEALAELRGGLAPDLVMLDLSLPDAVGVSGCTALRDAAPSVPIVVISALKSEEVVGAVMAEGASGFIPKDAPIAEMKAALAAVAEGRRAFPPGARAAAAARSAGGGQTPSERLACLTPQHARIMRLICEGKQNKQIAYELSLAEATVKAHITALLRRLGVQNRTQAAVLAEGVWGGEGAPDGQAGAARAG